MSRLKELQDENRRLKKMYADANSARTDPDTSVRP